MAPKSLLFCWRPESVHAVLGAVTCHSRVTRQNYEVSADSHKNKVAHCHVVGVLVAQHKSYRSVVHLPPPVIITASWLWRSVQKERVVLTEGA